MRNLYEAFLEVNVVLPKYILIWHRYWSFQRKTNCSNHCNQQQQTPNNQQVCMYSIQPNSKIRNSRCCSPVIIPKRIVPRTAHKVGILACKCRSCRNWACLKRTFNKWLSKCLKCGEDQAKAQYTCYRISSSLMPKNFCRRNIQKHYHKQKQNSKCPNINQQLQQNKIFKTQQYQKSRAMQKQQNQIKNRMYGVFRSHHLKNTHQCTCCNQSKRATHLFFFLEFYKNLLVFRHFCSLSKRFQGTKVFCPLNRYKRNLNLEYVIKNI